MRPHPAFRHTFRDVPTMNASIETRPYVCLRSDQFCVVFEGRAAAVIVHYDSHNHKRDKPSSDLGEPLQVG